MHKVFKCLWLLFLSLVACQNNEIKKDFGHIAYYVPPLNDSLQLPLPVEKLSHVVFSFTRIENNQMIFRRVGDDQRLRRLLNYKSKHPNLKVLIAVGGWNDSDGFSTMAESPETRKIFIESIRLFMQQYPIDGIDIDWEYPCLPGEGHDYSPNDKVNFTLLMKELREMFNQANSSLTLSFAAAAWTDYYENMELSKVAAYVDYINIMTYDMELPSSPYCFHHANLYPMELNAINHSPMYNVYKNIDSMATQTRSVHTIVDFMINEGVEPSKLVIGAAFYGHSYKGVSPNNHGLYQQNQGAWKGWIPFYLIDSLYYDRNGFKLHWDSICRAPFLQNAQESIFITFDNPHSIACKKRYARDNGLGGIMLWELGLDNKANDLLNALVAD